MRHKPYQEKRIIERRQRFPSDSEKDILKDERMAWLAFHIEAPIKAVAEKEANFADKDALLSLEYAKEKVKKGGGVLFIPNEKIGPKNELGEAICESIEKCRYEKKIILPGEINTYSTDEKIKCLERIMLSIKYWARDNLEGREYTERLLERFSRLQESSPRNKVILPS